MLRMCVHTFVQVPLGKLAFMPGQLYHTNEVMVLLGDNWFAKRTVSQALAIAERRKKSECVRIDLLTFAPRCDLLAPTVFF